MKTGIVVCTRTDSERIPRKPLVKVNGVPILEHLLNRLTRSGIQTYLATPHPQMTEYLEFPEKFPGKVQLFSGSPDDPLERTNDCAIHNDLDVIIRVCHDKVFVEPEFIWSALDVFHKKGLDYLYSSQFPDGTSFEIISRSALTKAAESFTKVEHISYAIRAVTDNKLDWDYAAKYQTSQCRLLVDFPEDLKVLEAVLVACGNDCTFHEAVNWLESNPQISSINFLPCVTIYTCAYNASEWIEKCQKSVRMLELLEHGLVEYIQIDDFSDDDTFLKMLDFERKNKGVRTIRNQKNIGLSSSSNVALKNSRGKYIIRMDADDYFVGQNSLPYLVNEIIEQGKDVIYPNNYFGDFKTVQKGKEFHHIGGALFRRSAINHIKFTEGLRGLEGFDLWARAQKQLNIGYLNKPTFFYRQHDKSMSKNNLEEREKIKKSIEDAHGL